MQIVKLLFFILTNNRVLSIEIAKAPERRILIGSLLMNLVKTIYSNLSRDECVTPLS